MYEADRQLTALRRAYQKSLLSNLCVSALSGVVAGLMLSPQGLRPTLLLGIAVGLAVAFAIVEYTLERALYRRGKRIPLLLAGSVLLLVVTVAVIDEVSSGGEGGHLLPPAILSYLLIRPLLPTVSLLRDGGRLREGDLCEAVGRMKKNTRRKEVSTGTATYLLFEDERTHETHLLCMGSVSPHHRYRVLYLPHSGLAVGEPIPDDVTLDPFGNPIERMAAEADSDQADAAPYKEKAPDAAGSRHTESPARESLPDPSSPEREKAARLAVARKVCTVLAHVFSVACLLGVILTQIADASPLVILLIFPSFIAMLLGNLFQSKELKLRCTKRTTAFCVDTVRRRSGRSSHLHPIVEYEVGGETRTAELSVTCTRSAVGDLYTIYYDPLDPSTVRVG